ncbi:MAG: hypothetical protein PHX72_00490 [Candidatus Shapirobacteria bacterium]|nr:hypothetical protein [Candidatus Shapirobacteria bacterium]
MGQKKTVTIKNNGASVDPEVGADQMVDRAQKSSSKKKSTKKTKKNEDKKGKSASKVKRTSLGAKYLKVKKLVDKNKVYPVKEAVSLLAKTAWAGFDEMAEAHLVIKQENFSTRVNFPYFKGKKKLIAIADDKETMTKIESGRIDFDVLLASPKMMPKLIPYARVLGPRGLMPNPKEGTVTLDPAKKAKELASSGVKIRTEKKFPLIHTVFGRTSQKSTELKDNLEALIKAVGRHNIKKLVISSTMGPGIRVCFSD